ncbi:MAG TPA: T9SS type A sorting domain-containing protein [Puia sp.]|nr:T9SS type A sorting domain-containing protein [Puia sp.]
MRNPTFIPVLLLAGLSLPIATRSQISQNWARSFATLSGNYVRIATDGSGNVFTVGNSGISYVLVKYNSAGTLQWAVPGPAGGSPVVVGIGTDNAGNAYVVTNTSSGATAAAFSPLGTLLWNTTVLYNGGSTTATVMTTDGAGNVYIGGEITTASQVFMFMTAKITGGVEQWISSFRGVINAFCYATGIVADASGNAYVTGIAEYAHTYVIHNLFFTITEHDTSYDIATIKYDPSGNALWTNTYNGGIGSSDFSTGIALNRSSGSVYVMGQTTKSGTLGVILAYSSTGAQLWVDAGSTISPNTSIAVDPTGNILTGRVIYDESGFSVSKYDTTGALTWFYYNNTFPIQFNSMGYLIMALDKQGNCYVTGRQNSSGNYAIAEVTASGSLGWSTVYSTGGAGGSSGIAIYTPAGRPGQIVYPEINIAGTSAGGADFTTVQYAYHPENAGFSPDPVAGPDNALAVSPDIRLFNYPNPFRGQTTIAYTLANNSHVDIVAFDQAGHPIATIFSGHQSAGSYTLPFAASRLAPGIYHYRIIATSPKGNFVQTKQMLVL